MYRLTDENGLKKGNFNYDAVKEAVEKLYRLEELLDEHKVKDWLELDERLAKSKKCEMPKGEENFKPHLIFDTVESECLKDIFEIFFLNHTKQLEPLKCGYIGQETNLVDNKNNKLNVGDVVVVKYQKDDFTKVEKTTIIVEHENHFFPMGFEDFKKQHTLTRVRKCTDLKHGERFANSVKAVLKQEEK